MEVGEKAKRVLVFLVGLRVRAIAAALATFGLSPEELARGWALFFELARTKLASGSPASPAIVAELDAWENLWFPVASATLRARHPEAHAVVFRNLTQSSGLDVVMGVRLFLERLSQLGRPIEAGGVGAEAPAVLALLASRGLTAAKLDEARVLLAKIAQPEPAGPPTPTTAEEDAAERAMWSWYLEWSEIARAAITSRRDLRTLGFLKNERGEVVEDPTAVEPRPELPLNGGPPFTT